MEAASTTTRRLPRWLPWLAALIPTAVLLWTARGVVENYSAVPFMDYWENFYWWRRLVEDGHLPAAYFFSQHNEHRIPLPRLIYFADIKWFAGTQVLNLSVIAAIQLAAVAMFVTAARRATLRWQGALALILSVSLMLWAAPWENLIWGFQVQFVGVYAAGAWAILLFCLSSDGGRLRWALMSLAILVMAVATYSMANGVFAGIAMVLTGVIARRGWRPVALAAAATAVLLATYLHGYYSVPQPAPEQDGLVLRFISYLLTYLGNIWALARAGWGLPAGAIGVLLTAGMMLLTWFGRIRDPARVAMLGIVLFVGMSACVTSLGRLGYGPEQALSSRYQTPVSYFWAAQALFWGLTLQTWRRQPLFAAVAATPLVLALLLVPVVQRHALHNLYSFREHVLLGASALVGGVDDEKALLRLYPEAQRVRDFRAFLRSRGLGIFADDPGYQIGSVLPRERLAAAGVCTGSFDTLDRDPGGGEAWRALGWGWDNEQGRPFERVLLTGPDGIVAGVALEGMRRDDVPKVLRHVRSDMTGWVGYASPTPTSELSAYGVRRGGTLCEIGRKAPAP